MMSTSTRLIYMITLKPQIYSVTFDHTNIKKNQMYAVLNILFMFNFCIEILMALQKKTVFASMIFLFVLISEVNLNFNVNNHV